MNSVAILTPMMLYNYKKKIKNKKREKKQMQTLCTSPSPKRINQEIQKMNGTASVLYPIFNFFFFFI